MNPDQTQNAASQHYLGRQPILDGRQRLIGYELLFRNSATNRAAEVTPGMATADLVCKAFTELGLGSALDGYKAFIIIDEAFLGHDAIKALPPEAVVFELDAGLADRPLVVERCLVLGKEGYSFCLMHGEEGLAQTDFSPLAEYASFIKLNVAAFSDQQLRELLAQAATHHLISIASHVETREQHQRALALGFQFFQGYYFAEPKLIEGKKVDPLLHGLMQVINLINQDAELSAIEQVFKTDAALTLKLLRLTNSVGVGLRTRIGSVRQAITLIGRRPMLRWLQLLMYSHGDGDGFERNPLMQLAALKANFMERLARHCYPHQGAQADLAFLAGLMSLMPALLGMPMEEIVEQIAVAPQLREALLSRGGDIGLLLELADRYDDGDTAGTEQALNRLGTRCNAETLNRCLAEAIAWVQSLAVEAE